MPAAHRPLPIHLKPAAPLAERVLLPGDPHRALQVAQHLLEQPRMLNHHRGLWGYTGEAPDGSPLSVQSTGMGGPSAAIVVEELIGLGARTLVRIGTCGALDPALELGDLIVAGEALSADGTSAALGAGERVPPDPGLTAALARAAGCAPAPVASCDLFYDERPGEAAGWRARGAIAVEMEAAALFRLAGLRGVLAGCLLAVSDRLDGDGREGPMRSRERIGREDLEAAGLRLGDVAYAALSSPDGATTSAVR
ncbi:MAG: purine-nucleoside phosphorylase [Thermoleophilaceae bacterium]|nr:purine-nucleoside phosphorylase [Thermoleophilaceae bacterium]